MRDDYNYQTTDKKHVAGQLLMWPGVLWCAEEDWTALVDAVERDNEQRDRWLEALMECNDQRSSAGEPD